MLSRCPTWRQSSRSPTSRHWRSAPRWSLWTVGTISTVDPASKPSNKAISVALCMLTSTGISVGPPMPQRDGTRSPRASTSPAGSARWGSPTPTQWSRTTMQAARSLRDWSGCFGSSGLRPPFSTVESARGRTISKSGRPHLVNPCSARRWRGRATRPPMLRTCSTHFEPAKRSSTAAPLPGSEERSSRSIRLADTFPAQSTDRSPTTSTRTSDSSTTTSSPSVGPTSAPVRSSTAVLASRHATTRW